MDVRGPAAVRRRRSDAGERLAGGHALADAQRRQRVLAEVSVEREERDAVLGLVAQHDERAVVERRGVVRQDVHRAVEGRAHRRSRLDEEIDPEVNRTALLVAARAERRRSVERTRLAVAPHPDLPAHPAQLREESVRQRARLGGARVGAEEEARDAEVEDVGVARQVGVQHAGKRTAGRSLTKPCGRPRAVSQGRKAARRAQGRVSEGARHAREPLERLPRRRLADGDVRVAGPLRRHDRGVRDAHRETRPDQREDDGDLVFGQREGPVVAAHDRRRRGEHVRLAEKRVRRRDRRLGHDQPVVHVAEVDDADDRVRFAPRAVHERVPVVAVAVDDGLPEAGQHGRDLVEALEEALGQCAPRRVGDAGQRVADPARPREVPLQLAMGRGVIEAGERAVHVSKEAPEALVQLVRPGPRLGQRHAVDPRQEERETSVAPRVRDPGDGPAVEGGHDPRQRQRRRLASQVPQDVRQHRDEARVALAVHDLQHERAAVGGVEAEVVVELAGQGRSGALDAEGLAREAGRENGTGRRGGILRHHGPATCCVSSSCAGTGSRGPGPSRASRRGRSSRPRRTRRPSSPRTRCRRR